jgi:hypothetical protein
MQQALEFLEPDNWLAYLLIIVGLWFVGGKMNAGGRGHRWPLRLGAGAFVVYACSAAYTDQPSRAENYLPILLKGALAAGLVSGAALVLLPIATFVYDHTLGASLRAVRAASARTRRRSADRRTRRQQEEQRKRDQQSYENAAPERERARLQAQAYAYAAADAQRRRDQARASCTLLYDRYAVDIAKRYTKEMFTEFVSQHMTDQLPAELVEQRAEDLKNLLRQHYETVHPPSKFRSIEEAYRWQAEQIELIEHLPIPSNEKQVRAKNVRDAVDEWIEEHIEEGKL